MAIRTDVRIGELGSLQRLIDDPRTPEIHRKDAQRRLEKLLAKSAKDTMGGRRARLHRALDKVMDRRGARDGFSALGVRTVLCPDCYTRVPLKNGAVLKHFDRSGNKLCPGSSQPLTNLSSK